MQVHVYTRSNLVKLEMNGKILEEKTMDDTKSITATFQVLRSWLMSLLLFNGLVINL